MDSIKTKALVLRRTNYGEADRILSILTPEGKMSVMAKGVRREKSKLAGGIELFSVSDVVLHKGRGELLVLTSARLVEFYGEIMKSLEAMEMMGAALKEVSRRAEQVGESEYFDLIWQALRGTNRILKSGEKGKLAVVQAWLNMNMARVSGEEINLRVDVAGERLRADAKYMWDRAEQALREDTNGRIGPEHIKLMRLMMSSQLDLALKVVGVEGLMDEIAIVAGRD